MGWLLGAVWYTVLSKPWQQAAGITAGKIKQAQKTPAFYLPFIVAFLAIDQTHQVDDAVLSDYFNVVCLKLVLAHEARFDFAG